jgi:hypothetical protein
MGPGKRFENVVVTITLFDFSLRQFLIGFSYDTFRYDHDLTINIGFITVCIGIGKSYLEREQQ